MLIIRNFAVYSQTHPLFHHPVILHAFMEAHAAWLSAIIHTVHHRRLQITTVTCLNDETDMMLCDELTAGSRNTVAQENRNASPRQAVSRCEDTVEHVAGMQTDSHRSKKKSSTNEDKY